MRITSGLDYEECPVAAVCAGFGVRLRGCDRRSQSRIVAGSPCAKMVAAGSYSMRCSGTPVQSTKSAGVGAVALLGVVIRIANISELTPPDGSSA